MKSFREGRIESLETSSVFELERCSSSRSLSGLLSWLASSVHGRRNAISRPSLRKKGPTHRPLRAARAEQSGQHDEPMASLRDPDACESIKMLVWRLTARIGAARQRVSAARFLRVRK